MGLLHHPYWFYLACCTFIYFICFSINKIVWLLYTATGKGFVLRIDRLVPILIFPTNKWCLVILNYRYNYTHYNYNSERSFSNKYFLNYLQVNDTWDPVCTLKQTTGQCDPDVCKCSTSKLTFDLEIEDQGFGIQDIKSTQGHLTHDPLSVNLQLTNLTIKAQYEYDIYLSFIIYVFLLMLMDYISS